MLTVIARFKNSGIPATGLNPTVTIRDKTDNKLVTSASMTEMSNGFYKYDFTAFSILNSYIFDFDGGVTLSDTDRYPEEAWQGIQDWIAQIPVKGAIVRQGGISKEDVKQIKTDIIKSVTDLFQNLKVEVDTQETEKNIKSLEQNAKKIQKELEQETKKAIKAITNEHKLLLRAFDAKELSEEQEAMKNASQAIIVAFKGLQEGLVEDMADMADILRKSAAIHKKKNEEQEEAMADLAEIIKKALDLNEERNNEFRNKLRQLSE